MLLYCCSWWCCSVDARGSCCSVAVRGDAAPLLFVMMLLWCCSWWCCSVAVRDDASLLMFVVMLLCCCSWWCCSVDVRGDASLLLFVVMFVVIFVVMLLYCCIDSPLLFVANGDADLLLLVVMLLCCGSWWYGSVCCSWRNYCSWQYCSDSFVVSIWTLVIFFVVQRTVVLLVFDWFAHGRSQNIFKRTNAVPKS